MAKNRQKDNLSVYTDVVASLALAVLEDVKGISPTGSKHGGRVSVIMSHSDRVTIDTYITVAIDGVVPEIVSEAQEKIKIEIEGKTKYKVSSVNVHVIGVYTSEDIK